LICLEKNPETRGKTFEEIQNFWHKKGGWDSALCIFWTKIKTIFDELGLKKFITPGAASLGR
jgi:hypothetical protein